MRYVTIRVEQIDPDGSVVPGTIPLEHRIALAPSARIVQLKQTLGLFWRLASGVALGPESLDEVVADVSLSFTPYVGVYPDLRDAAINLAQFVPGGEEPSKWELSLALLGTSRRCGRD